MFLGAFGFSDSCDYELSKIGMIMKHEVYAEQTMLVTRKTFPFMYLLDDLVLMCQQAGVLRFDELMASIRTTDYRIQRNLQAGVVEEDEIIPLKIAHIAGALYLLTFGYSCAAIAFTIENITHRLAKSKVKQQRTWADKRKNV